ncbi:hypothetical protein [Carboxylicivirga caseinilyticus]|uniref:hypothetical protein n=1 Tax=Carboxylicivirga caseinilyticus TaxID=3417572 RepID=UPI003D344743|nr:hypothetical protein [Marinilabiliaceae bacterium A049]
MTTIFLILIPLAAAGFWLWKKGIFILAEHYAVGDLESILFSNGAKQKETIISSMKEITKEKYTNEELLDYFLKIKGLQVINFYDPVSFWTRKYLMSPTKLKLNYFEQVKFYETFLNYPALVKAKRNNSNGYMNSSPKGLFINKKQLA